MKNNNFFKEYHKSLLADLSKISDFYRNSMWYFLTTIAALGTAYLKIYNINSDVKNLFFLIISLTGNIIFWLLCEYALSHAFLYRFVQSKLAKIEKTYDKNKLGKIKDPTDITNFIKINGIKKLEFDYFIPDQFVPLYWASIWLIIINTLFSSFLIGSTSKYLFCNIFFSAALIMKILKYYLYKLNKFINENCKFRIVLENSNNNFFELSSSILPSIILLIFFVIVKCICEDKFVYDKSWLIFLFLIYFWQVLVWLIIHFLKTILNFNDDIIKYINSRYEIQNSSDSMYSIKINKIYRTVLVIYYIA